MRLPCGWLTYTLSICIHCLPSFSRPTETALIPLCLFCHSPARHATESSDKDPGLRGSLWSSWFDQMSDIGLCFISYRIHVCILCVCTVSSFDGAAWPPARCTNDNFLWSGCNGLAPASAAPPMFAYATRSDWVCVFCGDADNIPRSMQEEDSLYQGGILMFIYTMANKMCARQLGETEWWWVIKLLCFRFIHYPYSSLHT